MAFRQKICAHLTLISEVDRGSSECEQCVATGDTWVHLRTCQSCGVTLCCDSSPNKHASKHASVKGHPVIASAEPVEKWLWCYEHKELLKY